MKELSKIGDSILEKNQEPEDSSVSEKSYFKDPTAGQLNYHSFSDFSSESELVDVLKGHLGEYGLSDADFTEMASLAYKLYDQKNSGDDKGDVSEFVYIMH